jgi:ribosome modulation factor
MNGPISQMPGKRTNKEYEMQGWNAALAGFAAADCPYFATSTAEKYWLRGFRSA